MIKKTYSTTLTTVEQTLYEVPLGRKTQWSMLYATNISGSTKNFTVRVFKNSEAATLTFFNEYVLASNDFFKIGGGENEFVMLDEGDKILVTGSANDAITLVLSVVEYNDIVKGG